MMLILIDNEGSDCIELDVHLTADNQIVVIHDGSIDRTSNGSGYVSAMTYRQLLDYDFSNGKEGNVDAIISNVPALALSIRDGR